MANIKFYIEKRKDKSTGNVVIKNVPILLSFTFDSKRMWIPTGEKIDANRWDEKKQKVKSSYPGCLEINNVLDSLAEKVLKIYRDAKVIDIEPTIGYIRSKLTDNKPVSNKSFFQLFQEFIDSYENRGTLGTIKKLNTNLTHLRNFSRIHRFTIEFAIIDDNFLNKYINYFINNLNHTNNTIAKNIKVLKWFLNWATQKGYNKNLAFKTFGFQEHENEIIVLTDEELMHLYKLPIQSTTLNNVRDVFCFCCLTGLRHSDVKNLKKTDIVNDVIHIQTIKTKSNVTIPLVPLAKNILLKYSDNPSNNCMPVMSNQKMNQYLKELGCFAKLKRLITTVKYQGTERIEKIQPLYEVLSTHQGRKTFISYMFRQGIRAEIIMQISNHKTHRSFAKYNKIDESLKKTAMSEAFGILTI